MAREKIKMIIVVSLLGITTISLILVGILNPINRELEKNPNEDEVLIIPKQPNLFRDEINSLDSLSEEDLREYLKLLLFLFPEKSYTQFTDEEISIFLAYEILNGKKVTNYQIQDIVKIFFGKEKFKLKEGKYSSKLDSSFEIKKEGIHFTTTISGKGIFGPVNILKKIDKKENKLILYYEYQETTYNDEKYKVLGTTTVYLNYKNKHLSLEKIIYKEQ